MALPANFLRDLSRCVSEGHLMTDPADCWLYSYDNGRHRASPSAVIFARKPEEISKIVKCCYENYISIVARGRGTGTPGGSVPVQGGVVLSLEKMNKIINVDPANRCITVEAGVLNQAVQDAVYPHGFFWAPDPSSAAFCTIGGNLGFNAAGPRAVKYGTTREHTLGLKAVLGNGETIRTGTYTTKGAVGYDFTRLLIGSEGTLGIITEAILKLTPSPETKNTLRLIYKDIKSAADAVTKIMSQPYIPCALEFIDHACVGLIQKQGIQLPENAGTLLLIEVDGAQSEVKKAQECIIEVSKNEGLIEALVAKDAQEAKSLWAARKAISPALRTLAPKKINEDVVVPVAQMPELFIELQKLSERYQIPIVNFGHAGSGNIHVNLLLNTDNPSQQQNADACLSDVFDAVIKLQGTLSGEHGIGIEKRSFIDRVIDPVTLNLMRAVKQQFDPRTILNPGKIFP